MKSDIVSIDENAKVNEAVAKMIEHNIGSIAVKKEDQFVGIVTERDILKKCCKDNVCTELTTGKIMSSPLITVDAMAPIGKAAKIMNAKDIRRLLVESNGNIVRIITQKAIIRETLNIFLAFQCIAS